MSSTWQLLKDRSLLVILIFGFSSGLPLALTGSTLQAWLAVAKIPLQTIGWLSLLGQPYIYKFIWAPLLDRYSLAFLGRRRGWLIVMQLCLLLSIGAIGFLEPVKDIILICILSLLVSFFSATQDILIDAYRTEILSPKQQGLGAASYITSYRGAMLVSGGLALIMADRIGWQKIYFIMAGLMLIGITATLFAREPIVVKHQPRTLADFQEQNQTKFWKIFTQPLKEFLARPHAIAIIIFIIFYKLGEAFAVSLSSTFLIRGLDFSLKDIGSLYKTIGILATLSGAYLGGLLLNHIKLYRSLLFFGIFQALGVLFFAWLALVGKSYTLLILTIFIENLFAGMATTAFMVFLMRLCNKDYTATQYALFAALSAVGRVFVGPVAGYTATNYSWANFFFIAFALTLPGLGLLVYLQSKAIFADDKI